MKGHGNDLVSFFLYTMDIKIVSVTWRGGGKKEHTEELTMTPGT